MEPTVEPLDLPEGYGTPKKRLKWAAVRALLEAAEHYWVASVRPDGRPHVVPKDGLWIDDAFYYGGSDGTVHRRNVHANPQVVMHLEDATGAVIVEGKIEEIISSEELAQELDRQSKDKYGYSPGAAAFAKVTRLSPTRVLAWTDLPKDATRFVFS